MIKKVCIVGSSGNMGKRYGSILDYLKIPYQSIDVHNFTLSLHSDVDGIIICTPTDKHYQSIMEFADHGLPILCEKPITKNLSELYDLLKLPIELSMINQYRFFDSNQVGLTSYNFYNSGSDGLIYDCINLIGMATDNVYLSKVNPVWSCMINGSHVNRKQVDDSYLVNIKNWVTGRFVESKRYIKLAHERCDQYEKNLKRSDWYTGKEVFVTSTGEVYKTPNRDDNGH